MILLPTFRIAERDVINKNTQVVVIVDNTSTLPEKMTKEKKKGAINRS